MKIFFTRTEIEELKNKAKNGLELMKKYPPEKKSKEEGVFYAFEAFLIALENLDK